MSITAYQLPTGSRNKGLAAGPSDADLPEHPLGRNTSLLNQFRMVPSNWAAPMRVKTGSFPHSFPGGTFLLGSLQNCGSLFVVACSTVAAAELNEDNNITDDDAFSGASRPMLQEHADKLLFGIAKLFGTE